MGTTNHHQPILLDEFAPLIARTGFFEKNPILAVAISGGVDSMALLLLTDAWAKHHGGRVIALTVDHRLRPESTQEAQTVYNWCKKKNIEHHVLTWQTPSYDSAIQSRARDARYQLLTDWCKAHNIIHLLTAHHQSDQGETLFFRLARGSGLEGLACMATVSSTYGVRLLRPLLSVPKSRLQATLMHLDQRWVEDPSNQAFYYTRNALRYHLNQTDNPEILAANAYSITQKLGHFRHLLDNDRANYLPASVSLFPEGYAIISMDAFSAMPLDHGIKTLACLTQSLTGGEGHLRSEKLHRLYTEIMQNRIRRRTFAGLLFIANEKQKYILVCREPKAAEGEIFLKDQMEIKWDKRFYVALRSKTPIPNLSLRGLGKDGIKLLKALSPYSLGKRPIATVIVLPALWNLDELVAVPHMPYINPNYGSFECTVRYRPAKALAEAAFFSMNEKIA